MPSLLFHSAFFNAPAPFTFALLAVLFAAALYDIKTFTIPHIFTFLVIGLFVVSTAMSGMNFSFLIWHFLSVIIAFVIGFALFAFRLMGGGDVKIFTALALWFFPLGLIGLIFCITTVGVLISLGVSAYKLTTVSREASTEGAEVSRLSLIRKIRIPYGPAIALGTLIYLILSKNLGL